MGIRLVEEVMDFAPDSLTATEWKGLVVLARDANDGTRLTFSKVNSPEILRRVRMSQAVWANVRSALIRKGVLVVAEQGVRGRSARYLIPVLAPAGIPHGSGEDRESGVDDLHGSDEESLSIPHRIGDESDGFFIDPMTPTPLSSSTTSPPSPPSSPPASAGPVVAEERVGGRVDAPLTGEEQRAAEALARATASVPQLVLGTREIAGLAPLVVPWLERTTEARMREALTAGLPAVVGSPVGLVRRRLLDKLPPAVMPVQAPHGGLPPWCGQCGDDNPAARYNPRFRTTPDGGLCACHPDAA